MAQGVPARCVGASLRVLQKTWRLGPSSFWTSCGIYLKGTEVHRSFLFVAKAFRRFPEVVLSETAGAGLARLNPPACTDGEDRFGVKSPATGSNLENPVRPLLRSGGRM